MQEGQFLITGPVLGVSKPAPRGFSFSYLNLSSISSLRHSPHRMNPQPLGHLNLVLCLFRRITTHLVFAASGRWGRNPSTSICIWAIHTIDEVSCQTVRRPVL